MWSHQVEIIEEAALKVVATRMHTSKGRIAVDIGTGFGALMQAMGRNGVTAAGSPLIIYHDVIDDETDGDIEMCVPVSGNVTGDSVVYQRELEGGQWPPPSIMVPMSRCLRHTTL